MDEDATTRGAASPATDDLTDDAIRRAWSELWSSGQEMSLTCRTALDATGARRDQARAVVASALRTTRAAAPVVRLDDLEVTGGATGIRTSQLDIPVRVDRIRVSGPGSVGIDLDDDGGQD